MMLCFLLVDKHCVILDVFLCPPTQIGSLKTLTAIAIFVWELVRLLIDDFINFMNYREFNPVRALYNFQQVYRNILFAVFLLYPNITEEYLAQNQ